MVSCNSGQSEKETDEQLMVEDRVAPEVPEYTGRLYSSGLSLEEAEKLQLHWPVYQLSGQNSYFFSGHDSLESYIGRCIGIEAAELLWKPTFETVHEQFTYNRGALVVSGIKIMDPSFCSFADGGAEELASGNSAELFSGRIRRMSRPAPDIAYDYALQLEEPFRDENNPIEPGKLVEALPLFIFNQEDVSKIENAIASDRKVEVEAVMVQGYAERKALQVIVVKE